MADGQSRGTHEVLLGDLLAQDRGISVGVMYPGEHDPGGIPLIRAADVRGNCISPSPELRIAPSVHYEYRRTELEGGELLMTLVGDVGRCAVVPHTMRGWNAARAIAVMRFRRPDDAAFVRICLLSAHVRHLINVWSNTTVQQTLNLKEIRQLPLPWPAEPERKRIVDILGALDDKIELNRRMNDTLEEMARALFKSWFVAFDPVHAKAAGKKPFGMDDATAALFPTKFNDSALGRIPVGWSVQTLGALTTKIGSGATPAGGNKNYVADGVALIRSQNVHDYSFRWDGLVRITDEEAHRLRGVTVQAGDVLLNITGDSILRTCVVDDHVLPARVNQHVAIIRAAPGVSARYLHLTLVQSSAKSELLSMDAGGTRQAITKAHLEKFPILAPGESLCRAFDRAALPLFSMVNSGHTESRRLSAVRDALLPKLLSGELRIKDAERIVGEAT